MRLTCTVLVCALLLVGAAPGGVPSKWDETASRLLLYLSTDVPSATLFEIVYAPGATACIAAEPVAQAFSNLVIGLKRNSGSDSRSSGDGKS